ncbi:carbohydrate kinase family protein [Actinomadura sp. CNU-125]|uniref:carbohydrate kinase family protein n=1 Tax=Actinomadura sp. CNU-125 TaxID=1904961 RepID=UPI000B18D005|nr:PfkB family carbohydrate kinase [Actinomadura sp. CNU-125]
MTALVDLARARAPGSASTSTTGSGSGRARPPGTLAPLAARADHVDASPDELPLVGEPGRLLADGAREVVVKDGGEARSFTAAGVRTVPARRVRPVDSVGAGDGFVAGYLSGLLDGLDVEGRLVRAHTVGAFAVQSHGDWEGLPRRDELDLIGLPDGTALR